MHYHDSSAKNQLQKQVTNLMRSYTIDVFRNKDIWTVNAQIQLQHAPKLNGPLLFTLNPDFRVKEVLINNKSVSFTVKGTTISIANDSFENDMKNQTLAFIYQGKLNEWTMGKSGDQHYNAFVNGDDAFVPSYLAWYPLPGKISLYNQEGSNLTAPNLQANPVSPLSFKVNLHGFAQSFLSTSGTKSKTFNDTQVFRDSLTSGMSLLSGRFHSEHVKQLTIVVPTEERALLKPVIHYCTYADQLLNQWLKASPSGTLFFVPTKVVMNQATSMVLDGSFLLNSEQLLNTKTVEPELMTNEWLGYVMTQQNISAYLSSTQQKISEDNGASYMTFAAMNYILQKNMGNPEPQLVNNALLLKTKAYADVKSAIKNSQVATLKAVLKILYDKDIKDAEGLPTISYKDWHGAWQSILDKR
ncbi:hypothetical protein GCM10011391_31300 [Pullulanibacillus camelliae]|uniref:Uncharacterized protein n=1 Tax=Pullulanibacillus camelliae TaxID=1707096 RepID=A0A8J2YLJ2_9BACL|nr:hypothetical protein GCM10011391_31300 [Pullulanibacillus camelliae]